MSGSFDAEAYREKLRKAIQDTQAELDGRYGKEIKDLLGLSRAEIDAITPGTTDLETYETLMKVVKEASRQNIAQAELKNRIIALGETAVAIAKKSTSLAATLGL
jgi:hypothetical protein